MAKKTHISADAARTAILNAAEDMVVEVGPAGLRISAVAKSAGMAHPNIIHHFGSREGLLSELGNRVANRITERVTKAIEDATHADESQRITAIKRILDSVYTGNEGKIAVWMHLSGNQINTDANMQQIVSAAHLFRESFQQNASYENTVRLVTLVTHALIGEVVSGRVTQSAMRLTPKTKAVANNESQKTLNEDFRQWLAELMLTLTDDSLNSENN